MTTLGEMRDEAYIRFLHEPHNWVPGCVEVTREAFDAGWQEALKAASHLLPQFVKKELES